MWTEVISCCTHCTKGLQIRSFSGPYFPLFWLNTEIFGVNLRIQSKCEKYGPENSVFVQVLCRDCYRILQFRFCYLSLYLPYYLSFASTFSLLFEENCHRKDKKASECVFKHTAQNLKFRWRIWSHLLRKSLMENFIFAEVTNDLLTIKTKKKFVAINHHTE